MQNVLVDVDLQVALNKCPKVKEELTEKEFVKIGKKSKSKSKSLSEKDFEKIGKKSSSKSKQLLIGSLSSLGKFIFPPTVEIFNQPQKEAKLSLDSDIIDVTKPLPAQLRQFLGEMPSNVLDPELYQKAVASVKHRVAVWPSAYASGQLVKEYKRLGGRYSGSKATAKKPLDRWYREEWVNLCKRGSTGGYAKCGRSKSSMKDYPYCRPLKRISTETPMTVGELKAKWGAAKIKELCSRKRSTALPKGGKPRRIRIVKK